jgi:hypothetical protein
MPIICGDNKEVMSRIDANSIDAIVTDPPAGINFMCRIWDGDKGGRDQWIKWMEEISKECLRVIKPGGHALVWSIPRTSHWTAMAWENAGWEPRDKIVHIFGTGFPKSLDISKAIDKAAGVEREDKFEGLGRSIGPSGNKKCEVCGKWLVSSNPCKCLRPQDEPQSDAAKRFSGFGTGLKPAHEDWLLFRKPVEGTIAQNVLKYGVGGLNIDGCRVETNENTSRKPASMDGQNCYGKYNYPIGGNGSELGRFPSNLIIDDSPEVLALFPNTKSGMMKPGQQRKDTLGGGGYHGNMPDEATLNGTYGDSGSAARFFYCAKASPSERNMGCENLPQKTPGECTDRVDGSAGLNSPRAGAGRTSGAKNDHPTVKSLSLMKYLCRLITPPGGIILDPFCGSGSTGVAAKIEGFDCIMIDSDEHSCEIAKARLGGVKYK